MEWLPPFVRAMVAERGMDPGAVVAVDIECREGQIPKVSVLYTPKVERVDMTIVVPGEPVDCLSTDPEYREAGFDALDPKGSSIHSR